MTDQQQRVLDLQEEFLQTEVTRQRAEKERADAAAAIHQQGLKAHEMYNEIYIEEALERIKRLVKQPGAIGRLKCRIFR
jgi:hypothetical protein